MKITISSLQEIRPYLGHADYVLSVIDPEDVEFLPVMNVLPGHHLVLACHDVDSRAEAMAREREIPGSRCLSPTLEMVREALAFARQISSSDRLLVHCGFGISRSPAVALAILAQAEPDVPETELFRRILDLHPGAVPNALIVEHGDKLLKRSGRLSRAISGR